MGKSRYIHTWAVYARTQHSGIQSFTLYITDERDGGMEGISRHTHYRYLSYLPYPFIYTQVYRYYA